MQSRKTWIAHSFMRVINLNFLVSHIIYRSTDSTFVPTRDDSIATVLLPTVSFVDSGLVTGLIYYYRLASYDLGSNESLLSDQVSGAPLGTVWPFEYNLE